MSEAKRILQVVTHMNRGGLETMLMNYYRRIDRKCVQFDFLTPRQGEKDYDAEIRALGGRIYHVPPVNPLSGGYYRELDRFFTQHPEYRVVHSHLDCMSAFVLRTAQRHGVPVRLAHSHSSNQDRDWKYPIKLWAKRQIPAAATDLFACSRAAGEWMYGGAEFRVLPNAVDANAFHFNASLRREVRAELGLDDALVLGHVGRFDRVKNHGFLLDIFAAAEHMEPRSRLMLVGDGDERAAVEDRARELGLEKKVLFLGLRSDVSRLLQAMDVFILPSLYEGLSLAAVEAQAAGLPCLVSDTLPEEAVLTDRVQRLALTDPGRWARLALRAAGTERQDTRQAICAAGFDIAENTRWLEGFYLETDG